MPNAAAGSKMSDMVRCCCRLAVVLVLSLPALRAAAGAEDFFRPALVHRVDITILPGDWERLRRSAHPYPYFPADLEIDGRQLPWVGLRKKGTAGSLSDTRPALKVRLDRYVRGRRFLGLRRLTFNNALQDPALVRQCLAYRIYRRAGVPAPRCNYARMTVNGRDLGIYVNVESIDETFLTRNLGRGPFVLYEGTTTELAAGWRGEVERKGRPAALGPEPLDRLVAALYLPEQQMLEQLQRWLDIEALFRFWALTVLMANTDSFVANGSNFYLAWDGGRQRFAFIPWGADEGFTSLPDGSMVLEVAHPLLLRRLLAVPGQRRRYWRQLEQSLARYWQPERLEGWLQADAAALRTWLADEQVPVWEEELRRIRRFISGRRASVERNRELLQAPPGPGQLVAERPRLYFAPYRPGRDERLCTRLRAGAGVPPLRAAGFRDAALRAELEPLGAAWRLCVSLVAPARRRRHLLRVYPAGWRRALLPVEVITLTGPPVR